MRIIHALMLTIACSTISAVAQTSNDEEIVHLTGIGKNLRWNNPYTNGVYDVRWSNNPQGPWYDTWDGMLGVAATTNTRMSVPAPQFFRVTYRPLPADQVGSYIGYRWNCYRTRWDIGKEWISSLPIAREGFNYGASTGRGASISTHENDKSWVDYTVEFELEILGVNPALNPYSLPLDWRVAYFVFHLESMNEDWYTPSLNAYFFKLEDGGASGTKWTLGQFDEFYLANGDTRIYFDTGFCSADITATNLVKVSCIGNEISASVNGEHLVTYTNDAPKALTHGGVGFRFGHECMGRFKNMKITHLNGN